MAQDPTLAERHAAEVAARRERIDADRQRLGQVKAQELADSEAYALAQIRIRTEREAAHQADVLRDAERKAELAAIERRAADLDASKEARRRNEADQAARQAQEARSKADRAAEAAALEKKQALEQAAAALAARRQAEREAAAARRDARGARLAAFWMTLRHTSAATAAVVALLLGLAGGYGWAWRNAPRAAAMVSTGGEEAPLKLEIRLSGE
jgi:colicin import membrane protein